MTIPERQHAPSLRPDARPDPTRSIFINYRREDSGGQARALLYALERAFPNQVFMDVKAIAPGHDYLEEIARTVGSCRAVLVLIGRSWVDLKDAAGRRRLDDPRDVVTLEIAMALQRRDVLVIPVLVGGATVPAEESLPEALRDLVRRQCLQLTDQDWDYNVSQLEETLRRALALPAPGATRAGRRALLLGVAAAALALVAASGVMLWRQVESRRHPVPASMPERPSTASRAEPAAPAPAPAPASPPAQAPAPAVAGPATPAPPVSVPAPTPRPAPPEKPSPRATASQQRSEKPAASARAARSSGGASAGGSGSSLPTPPLAVAPAPASSATPPAAAQRPEPSRPEATGRQVFASREVLAFQQLFGDPALRERGRRLVDPARWVVEESSVTLAPAEPMPGFFPMTARASRAGDRITFEGSRTGDASSGKAYVRISGSIAPRQDPPTATVDIEIGRALGADASDHEPTYRARARVRLGVE